MGVTSFENQQTSAYCWLLRLLAGFSPASQLRGYQCLNYAERPTLQVGLLPLIWPFYMAMVPL
jgi:hypothetical protein